MIERVPGIVEITLEERQDSPNTIQLFLIRGTERSLLIDAAYSSLWCREKLLSRLAELNVSPAQLDVFLTHKHADHCGLARALQELGAVIYMNREEDRHQYDCLYYRKDHSNEKAQQRVLTRNGITPEDAPIIWEKFMDMNRHLEEPNEIWTMTMDDFQYENITAGQRFSYGDYQLEAVLLRGHTYGQMGLIDREKKLFFAADQILNRTVPIVGTSYADEHLLKCYLESVASMAGQYGDYTILPAHEGPIRELAKTAAHIAASYQKKLDQTLACMGTEEQTVWQIAKHVYGLTPARRSDFLFYQSKMITTKTFSLLEYLYDTGKITRREENGTLYWRLPCIQGE